MGDLAAYRTRITNSLDDTTAKYTTTVLDEALRKVLNEYTRAFPNIPSASVEVETAGKLQSISTCTNLIAIIRIVHPYNSALDDPYIYEREDFVLNWRDGSPNVFFSGEDIPQTDD